MMYLLCKVRSRKKSQIGSEPRFHRPKKPRIAEPPTTDLIAYDAYLRAKDFINDIALSTGQKKICFRPFNSLTRLLRATPCSLTPIASSRERMTEFISSVSTTLTARLKLSEAAIQSVRRLRPASGETHLALAQHHY